MAKKQAPVEELTPQSVPPNVTVEEVVDFGTHVYDTVWAGIPLLQCSHCVYQSFERPAMLTHLREEHQLFKPEPAVTETTEGVTNAPSDTNTDNPAG